MHSHNLFSKSKNAIQLRPRAKKSLNAYKKYGLTEYDILKRSWLKSDLSDFFVQFHKPYFGYHIKAFSILLKNGASLSEALLIVDQLTDDEAFGLCQGLNLQTVKDLEKQQIKNLIKYKLNKEDMVNRLWLTNSNCDHIILFEYLLNVKKLPLKECLHIVDQSQYNEIYGILKGFDIDEVKGLEIWQIGRMLCYGLNREDISDLNAWQIRALYRFGKKGLLKEDLLHAHWLENGGHFKAFAYLVTIKKLTPKDALFYIENISRVTAVAIAYGMEREQLNNKKDYQIDALLSYHKLKWMATQNIDEDFSYKKIQMVNELSHLGLSMELITQYTYSSDPDDKQFIASYIKTLSYLIVELSFAPVDALNELAGLSESQLDKIYEGLSRHEVMMLNEYQAQALLDFRTTKNSLSADFFISRPWFQKAHYETLSQLIWDKKYTVYAAFAKLDASSKVGAYSIATETAVSNFFYQQRIVESLNFKCDRDEAEYFLSKSSIHRETQVDILCKLINEDHYLVEEALALIADLNDIQLQFIRRHERDQLLSLTATQMIILNDKDLSNIHDLVISANWITTHTQYQLLTALSNLCFDNNQLLRIVKEITNDKDKSINSMSLIILEKIAGNVDDAARIFSQYQQTTYPAKFFNDLITDSIKKERALDMKNNNHHADIAVTQDDDVDMADTEYDKYSNDEGNRSLCSLM